MQKSDTIAVFDSGVGGLSVLGHLRRLMPGERYLYFGDSANAPYGVRPTAEVRELTLRAVEGLMEKAPLKALVIACNTATAAAAETLRETYPDLIIVGIEPALKLAADRFPGGRVGVMATAVTLREWKFSHLLHRFEDTCSVTKIPAPGLVELVEQGKTHGPELEALLHTILDPYVGKLEALVLGCTHYPFAGEAIAKILGPETALLDGGEGTARELLRRLEEADLLEAGGGALTILNSSPDPAKHDLARRLLEL